ncbi:MAG: tRNA-dihydrouridine synthase [Patescibacteria group bacterium]|nr:tRNA-dihydrouridine synthase [Patescibacteria group bacterium]
MDNFWEKLNKPFFALAPMEEVTDVAFREMFARYGKPDVMFTEFVCVDALCHPEARKKMEVDLKYTDKQRPIVAQIWGRSPLLFEEAAGIVADLGFQGIDINMGCPQDKEISLGTCAALIQTPALAIEIIKATKKGGRGLPVSVKTRLGYNTNVVDTWLKHLLSAEPAAITLHGRTKKEKSKVPANWEEIKKAVDIRNREKAKTLIVGNGDVFSLGDAHAKVREFGVDGVMVGRGAFGHPWFFRTDNYQPGIKEKLEVMLEHAGLFEEWLPQKSFFIMRKHFKAYASGFAGAADLRARLMETKNAEETAQVVKVWLKERA